MTSSKTWREIVVAVPTSSTRFATNYAQLTERWITAASEEGVNAVRVGSLPVDRFVDYASSNGEFVALLCIGDELAVLSLSHLRASECNVDTRMLEARAIQPGEEE